MNLMPDTGQNLLFGPDWMVLNSHLRFHTNTQTSEILKVVILCHTYVYLH